MVPKILIKVPVIILVVAPNLPVLAVILMVALLAQILLVDSAKTILMEVHPKTQAKQAAAVSHTRSNYSAMLNTLLLAAMLI